MTWPWIDLVHNAGKKYQGHILPNRLYYFNQSFWDISENVLISKAQHAWHQPVGFSLWFLSAHFCLMYLMYSHKYLNNEDILIVSLYCQQDNCKLTPLILGQFPTGNCHFSSILFWVMFPCLNCCSLGESSGWDVWEEGDADAHHWGYCYSAAAQECLFSPHRADSKGDAQGIEQNKRYVTGA